MYSDILGFEVLSSKFPIIEPELVTIILLLVAAGRWTCLSITNLSNWERAEVSLTFYWKILSLQFLAKSTSILLQIFQMFFFFGGIIENVIKIMALCTKRLPFLLPRNKRFASLISVMHENNYMGTRSNFKLKTFFLRFWNWYANDLRSFEEGRLLRNIFNKWLNDSTETPFYVDVSSQIFQKRNKRKQDIFLIFKSMSNFVKSNYRELWSFLKKRYLQFNDKTRIKWQRKYSTVYC